MITAIKVVLLVCVTASGQVNTVDRFASWKDCDEVRQILQQHRSNIMLTCVQAKVLK